MAYSSNYAQSYRSLSARDGTGGDRPATLNLQNPKSSVPLNSGGIGGGGGGGTTSTIQGGSNNMPHKPTRYTPVYPTLMLSSNNPPGPSSSAKSSSYSSLTSAPTSNYSPYNSYTRQASNHPQPSTSSSSNPPISQYYHPSQRLQQHNNLQPPQSSNLPSVSSKSVQNLVEDNVFCLSCPPAEYKFSDAYRAKTLPRVGKENERLIGFATLPEQVHRKSVKKGFDFTLMVVGESGLGKSTLINSLFLADFYADRKIPGVADLVKKTTTIQKHTTEIEERGVKLRLTVVDTPGFGDSINCEESWKTCIDYIDEQFHQYFQAESGLNRKHIQDGRVHCCLYFIPSYGRGLRQLDIQALKTLQTRVNIIPVIGKADILTPTEVRTLKDKILDDLKSNHIQMYQFPDCDEEEDDEFKKQDRELKASIPFAIASSDTFVEVAGKRFRGRVYPWGIVEVENPNHSDFTKLRTMLIQSHMHDLKETTQDLHYENFRAKAIAQIAQQNPSKERTKLKRDSSSDNNTIISSSTSSQQDMLLQKEAEIKRMQQMISKMEAKLRAAGQPQSRGESIDI